MNRVRGLGIGNRLLTGGCVTNNGERWTRGNLTGETTHELSCHPVGVVMFMMWPVMGGVI